MAQSPAQACRKSWTALQPRVNSQRRATLWMLVQALAGLSLAHSCASNKGLFLRSLENDDGCFALRVLLQIAS